MGLVGHPAIQGYFAERVVRLDDQFLREFHTASKNVVVRAFTIGGLEYTREVGLAQLGKGGELVDLDRLGQVLFDKLHDFPTLPGKQEISLDDIRSQVGQDNRGSDGSGDRGGQIDVRNDRKRGDFDDFEIVDGGVGVHRALRDLNFDEQMLPFRQPEICSDHRVPNPYLLVIVGVPKGDPDYQSRGSRACQGECVSSAHRSRKVRVVIPAGAHGSRKVQDYAPSSASVRYAVRIERERVKAMETGAIAILAAGRSTRMGGVNKLLSTFDGVPLIRLVACRAISTGCPVIVVTGYMQEDVKAAVSDLDVDLVFNEQYGSGISSSLRVALESAPDGCAGVLVHLGDMPLVSARDLMSAIDLFMSRNRLAIVRATAFGDPGNPVIIPRSLFSTLMDLEGDKGARQAIAESGLPVVGIEIGRAALCDVDTPETLALAGGIAPTV